MTDTPEQIARNTLTELGETPGPDPIAQLHAYAEHVSALLKDMRERMYLTRQPPADIDEYRRIADNTLTARVAAVHIQAAQETAQLNAILELPDAVRETDADGEPE